MPRIPHSCRHYRRESIKKYGRWFGKHDHRALVRLVCRESPRKRLQDMMYKALPPPEGWWRYVSSAWDPFKMPPKE